MIGLHYDQRRLFSNLRLRAQWTAPLAIPLQRGDGVPFRGKERVRDVSVASGGEFT